MGIVCGKTSASAVKDREGKNKERSLGKESSELLVGKAVSSRREDSFRVKKKANSGEINSQVVDRKASGSRRVRDDYYEKDDKNYAVSNYHMVGSVSKPVEGEQVAAGWPAWLASAAGEALKGWLPLKGDTFEKLDKIGQGTYSNVYMARDLTHNKVVALKKVRFDHMDSESVKFMAREILILRRLDHPNIIKLEGLIISKTSLYLVFEYMEHDLTGLASLPGLKFTEPQIKCYMQQLLRGLEHCHSRSVLHRDIKGSNLLIDNHGILKIADFGLANFFDRHQSIPLTSRVVTLWYRPPELLLGTSHYGTAVDLWSTGCILGELYTRKPIMPGRTEIEQLHKIFKLCGSPSEDYWRRSTHSTVFKPHQPYKRHLAETFKDLPAAALRLMDTLLSIDPSCRGSAASAHKSEFFSTEPFACDPSSLPKYPPSKEIDAKLRAEEAKRQGGLGVKSQRIDRKSWVSNDVHAVPQPDAKADAAFSTQQKPGKLNSKPRSVLFNSHKAEPASSFSTNTGVRETSTASCGSPPQRPAYSGPLGPGGGWALTGKEYLDSSFVSTRADLSNLSGLVASRTLASEDSRDKVGYSKLETSKQRQKPLQLSDSQTGMPNVKHQSQNVADSRLVETGRVNNKAPEEHDKDTKGSKIHFSGPLPAQPSKVEQMLKEHERQIQEAARRARLDKTRLGKFEGPETQMTSNPVYAYAHRAR